MERSPPPRFMIVWNGTTMMLSGSQVTYCGSLPAQVLALLAKLLHHDEVHGRERLTVEIADPLEPVVVQNTDH